MDINKTPSQPRAVLWDMDGTLLDSAEYHWLSWREALAAENYELTREMFTASFGQRNDTILRGYFGSDFPYNEIERISESKEKRYRELLQTGNIELLPGVQNWLQRLHAVGWLQAIASSAPLLNIQALLDALDISAYFDGITSAEDVDRGKPDPQVFLVAASKVNVPPARCIVVEDAPAGIEGARRAGMRTIGVLSTQKSLDADIVVETLEHLPEDAFERLLQSDVKMV
jgi:beta-phosphoglucomutase